MLKSQQLCVRGVKQASCTMLCIDQPVLKVVHPLATINTLTATIQGCAATLHLQCASIAQCLVSLICQHAICGQTYPSYEAALSVRVCHIVLPPPLLPGAWCYRAVHPPSMDKQAPVMDAASSLHRWRTSAATSSTRTKRFVG